MQGRGAGMVPMNYSQVRVGRFRDIYQMSMCRFAPLVEHRTKVTGPVNPNCNGDDGDVEQEV